MTKSEIEYIRKSFSIGLEEMKHNPNEYGRPRAERKAYLWGILACVHGDLHDELYGLMEGLDKV